MPHWRCLLFLCSALLLNCLLIPTGQAGQEPDITEMPLEQLMNLEVTTASKFPQKTMDAPAAVTVITDQDIREYGYRTLADALRSIRGINITYDRVYDYFGARGFGPTGDYNSRLLLMIDGRRVNDVVYDQAYLGTEGIIDMENVKRIEFVPGSGSSIYGSNAVFGVMNVITKQGADVKGAELAGGFASYGSDREKATYGQRFENGADVLLSASRYYSDGHKNLFYRDFDNPDDTPFHARNLDSTGMERAFGKFGYGAFTLEGAFVDRKKDFPIPLFGSAPDQPGFYDDRQGFVEARYDDRLTDTISAQGRLYYGLYDYSSLFTYANESGGGFFHNKDRQESQWWGGEARMIWDLNEHRLLLGSIYQSNFQQFMLNFDAVTPRNVFTDVNTSSHWYGLYLQDEYTPFDFLTLNAGLRYDEYSVSGDTLNPRLGLIVRARDDLTLKMLYGTAFRAPQLYELRYTTPGTKTPESLGPEHITTYEAVAEYQPTSNLRLTATAFRYDISDLIRQVEDPSDGLLVFANSQSVQTQGLEFESEYRWRNGTRLRSSYAFAYAKDQSTGDWLINSPKHLAKLNLSTPLYNERLRAGIEWQFVSDRQAKVSTSPSYSVVNLTLTANRLIPNLDISGSIYNFLDKQYTNVPGQQTSVDLIPQDGRNYRLWFTYHF